MTLATHAITGAAIASFIPAHPVAAFAAGFASHFIIDAIPHYDYPIYSDSIHPKKSAQRIQIDRAFLRDAFDFSLDAAAGILISVAAFASVPSFITVLAGAIGGILPDPLQFVAKKWRHEPLRSLQRFHLWIHTKHRLRESGQRTLGIVSQTGFVAVIVLLAKFF